MDGSTIAALLLGLGCGAGALWYGLNGLTDTFELVTGEREFEA